MVNDIEIPFSGLVQSWRLNHIFWRYSRF